MPNALLDETRSERLDLGLPMLSQLRCSPTFRALIDESKAADQSYADWFVRAAVTYLLLRPMMGLRLQAVNRLVVRMGGEGRVPEAATPDRRQEAPEALTTVREGKPEQLRLKTAMVAVSKRRNQK